MEYFTLCLTSIAQCFYEIGCCCACCFCNICCCECNCFIFPAPSFRQQYSVGWHPIKSNGIDIKTQHFQNKNKDWVCYRQISNSASLSKNQLIIYYHGNAEDMFSATEFAKSIFKSTQTTILIPEYPTYSLYKTAKKYCISDRIKCDCLDLHAYVKQKYLGEIYIIGRSIGTGPACYLASQTSCQKLVLISPFDSIKKVGASHAGWLIECFLKNHFSNEQTIKKFQGDLLVIHGQMDEVIKFEHGENLVEIYELCKQGKKCIFQKPVRMSHNNFNMQIDIVRPIKQFLSNN